MQCGLCAVVAGLFRRAMCIADSRRGSGESCYQELATDMPERGHSEEHQAASTKLASQIAGKVKDIAQTQEKRITEITVSSEEQTVVFVRISNSSVFHNSNTSISEADDAFTTRTELKRFSDADRMMLGSLDVNRCRPSTGRFLTMHKRRRKRLITRSLNQEPGILDDIFHGLVQCILQKAGNWQFNAFTLETVTGGRSLPVLCVHLFHWYGLLQHFKLDVVTIWKLFAFIEEGYHSTNPYHNSIHAADVTQAMHCFLQEKKIKTHVTNLEIMASLIAAVTHDLDHPGVNQPFLVATSNHLAALYKNTSVLENHHWRSAIGCLLESGVSAQLSDDTRSELERHIKSLILATDITRQQEFLTHFRDYLGNNSLEMKYAEDRHFILQIALKCADISNPCRPWDISRKWSYKVCEEFFRQGDYERRLNLPVTPLCDRHTTSIPKIQVGFFKHVVTPLYIEWHRFLSDDLSISLMEHLNANQKKWEILINQEATKETTETEFYELDENEDLTANSCEETSINEDSSNMDLLIPTAYVQTTRMQTLPGRIGLDRIGRRHSIPLNVSKSLTLSPHQAGRRESLPIEKVKGTNILLELEEQDLLAFNANTSAALSCKTRVTESNATVFERPVSRENLLPDTSIASITSSTEASRLNRLLQSDNRSNTQPKQLTRQQTFPPLQPYARTRYMSATAEMTQCCTEIPTDDNNCTISSLKQSCSNSQCCSLSQSSRVNILATKKQSRTFGYESERSVSTERCHSMKSIRTEDSLSIHKTYKRPRSAQDSNSTEIFYALLMELHRDNGNHMSDLSERKSLDRNIVEYRHQNATTSMLKERWTAADSSYEKLDDCILGKNVRSRGESRRYSIPITKHNSRTFENARSRRYTAIPVSSELDTHKAFFIGSPSDSLSHNHSVSSSNDTCSESKTHIGDLSKKTTTTTITDGKRESDHVKGKSSKMIKLSCDTRMKENVDPCKNEDSNKQTMASFRKGNQGLIRRRGSAPVGLLSKMDDSIPSCVSSGVDRTYRRGSVPADITKQQGGNNRPPLGSRGENSSALRRASLPQETVQRNSLGNILTMSGEHQTFSIKKKKNNNNNNNNNNINSSGKSNNDRTNAISSSAVSNMLRTRRGSVPANISELHHDPANRNNAANCKTRNRKKTLKRRSSGGPEMFLGKSIEENDNGGTWLKCKRETDKCSIVPEKLARRRGSLPTETVAISHAGIAPASHRGSAWRF